MRKAEKVERTDHLRQIAEQASGAILTSYRGLNVQQLSGVRRAVRQVGGRFHVIKNKLFLRAIEGTRLAPLASKLDGPTAVAFAYEDMGSVAKALDALRKDNELLTLQAACLEGKLLDPEQAKSLPTRHEALSSLVWCLEGPIQGLALALQGLISRLVWALSEIEEQKQAA